MVIMIIIIHIFFPCSPGPRVYPDLKVHFQTLDLVSAPSRGKRGQLSITRREKTTSCQMDLNGTYECT